jgi:hypothetical protein
LSAILDKTELGLHDLRHLAWYHREDSMQCALLLLRYCAVPRFSHVGTIRGGLILGILKLANAIHHFR